MPRQKALRLAEITCEQRMTDVKVKIYGLDICGRFTRRISAGSQAIANIEMNQTRLEGIKINQTDCFAAIYVE